MKLDPEMFTAMGKVHSMEQVDIFTHVIMRYCEPHRTYHNLEHIAQMLQWGANRMTQPLFWAIWYHDVVYKVGADNNEERSADLALADTAMLGMTTEVVMLVRNLILATKSPHRVPTIDYAAHELEQFQFIIDLDLGGFSMPWDEYRRNTLNIREEVAPETFWIHGGRSSYL